MAKSSSLSKTAAWILIGFLTIGLVGFGATNFSGSLRNIGSVGDKSISINDYGRAIQNEQANQSRQAGRAVSFAEMQEAGIDRGILSRLTLERALDQEAAEMGLSIGDENLRERVVNLPDFQGLDGNFNREAYSEVLRRAGLNENAFETRLREEASRNILQAAVVNGTAMPKTYADTLVEFIRSTRDFTYTVLDETALETPIADPSDQQLRAYFDENAQDYKLPPTKKITYAILSPDAMMSQVEVSDDELRRAYDANSATYNQAERRLVERLVFADQDAADRAAAALEVNGTTFEALVEERGLSLSDVDLGDVDQETLADAGQAVFAAKVGDVVGPAQSDLGPALFRVNGILPAQETSFEEAREELRGTAAADRAVRLVETLAADYDDMLAGGVTLEDLAKDSEMTLRQIDWTAGSSAGIAAYEDFREAAAELKAEDFPKIMQLDDGGIFAMRLDESLPERPAAFEDVADRVKQDWREAETSKQLSTLAEAALPLLKDGKSFEEANLTPTVETGLTRDAFLDGTPPGFMKAVFEMEPGDVRSLAAGGVVALIRVDASALPDLAADPQAQAIAASLQRRQNVALAGGLYNLLADDALARAGQQIDPRAVAAVNANFR